VSVVDNAVFRLSISSSVPEIFALKSKVVLNRVEFHMFLISIFGGGEFSDLRYKIRLIIHHGARSVDGARRSLVDKKN